jgi:hypothetical protein
MSLSKPRGTTSPVQRFFELKLAGGSVGFYDKEAKENKTVTGPAGEWAKDKKYAADPQFKFIILDILSFIGGFSDPNQSGIWSNEIRSTRNEKLVVRTKKGVLAEGLYEDIKGELKGEGGKFGNSVYLAFEEDGEWKLGNLKLIGAGVSAFFDFKEGKRFDINPGVAIVGWTGLKKGTNEYFSPAFESWDVPDDIFTKAVALDEVLQEYLSAAPAAAEEEPAAPAASRESAWGSSNDYSDEPPF